MNLTPLGANKTEVTKGDKRILFSYQTPVAFDVLTPEGRKYYKTETYYSRTTSKHINSWLPKHLVVTLTQAEFDEALEGVL